MTTNHTHTSKDGLNEYTDVYKPTIFTMDTLTSSYTPLKEPSERRSVRFSSIETAQPINKSSLITGLRASESRSTEKAPKIAQQRRAEGFSTVAQRPKSALAASGKRPIAESTDLSTMPDGGHYFPASSGSISDSKVSRISCANQPSQTSRSDDTRVDSSFSSTYAKVPRTSSARRNPLLDGPASQSDCTTRVQAEQEIPTSQFQVIKLLQAEYVLLLLRNERLQKYRAFCAFVYDLLTKTLRNKAAAIRVEVLRSTYTDLSQSLTAANTALQETSKRTLATVTPSVIKQLGALNDAVEACTATRLQELSLVPANECTERLSELIEAINEFLEHVSPIEADVAVGSTWRIDAGLISSLCRSTARLQALVYEAAILGHRKKHS